MKTLIAVDIGNSRVKLGRFRDWTPGSFAADRSAPDGTDSDRPTPEIPLPDDTLSISHHGTLSGADLLRVADWLEQMSGEAAVGHDVAASCFQWRIAEVNHGPAVVLADWVQTHRPNDSVRILTHEDVNIRVDYDSANNVGIDRLLSALAADKVRLPGHAAVIVDIGSCMTVDLLDNDRTFRGGAILPGPRMMADAMHRRTDLLPKIDVENLVTEKASPDPVGHSTESAMRAGLYWGIVGAIRELYQRQSDQTDSPCELIMTGGASGLIGDATDLKPRSNVRELTLAGIACVE